MSGDIVLVLCIVSFFIGRWTKKPKEKEFVYQSVDEFFEKKED